MAKRKRSPRRPSVPPPMPRAPKSGRRGKAPDPVHRAHGAAATAPPEDLSVRYAHVKRDLMRIAILAVVMLSLIYATTFLALT